MADSIEQIEKLISQGRYSEARSMAEVVMKQSDQLRPRQLYALAVSKSGAPKAAMEVLEPVYRQNSDDPETAGILGGIYKELFRKDQDTKYALLSRDTYLKNFSITRNYYTGINAATMSAVAGQVGRGREIAAEVISGIGTSPSDFWQQVTLAEAFLLTKEREKAITGYFEAKKMAGTDWGKVSTVHKQLWMLNHYVPVPKEILRVFSPPGVVSFIGHMIDHPSRKLPRFPSSIEGRVKEAIAGAINTMNAKIGFCSLACGSDILFAEAMAEAGGEVNIWLPFAKEDFVNASVRFAGGDWLQRFDRLFNQFPVTFITQEPYAGYDDLFSFQNRVIIGSAVIRSSLNHSVPTLLTVLSEMDLRQKEGGTRDTVNLWPYPDRHVNVNPDNFLPPQNATTPEDRRIEPEKPKEIDRPVLYALATDLQGVPKEVQHKLWEEIQKKMDLPSLAPVTFEADDLFIASFKSILGVMDLCRIIMKTVKPLRLNDKLRISLYGYPVLLEPGPEENAKKFGAKPAHQVRTLHSLIAPGAIYSFARFSSALALDISNYSLDYAGIISNEVFPQPLELYRVIINE